MDGKGTGIHWVSGRSLEDLQYAHDLALLSHSFYHIQGKTECLEEMAATVGLRINKNKTKLMKVKTVSPQRFTLTKGPIEEVEEFTYLGSVVSNTGDIDQDIEERLGKASQLSEPWTNCGLPRYLEEQQKRRYSIPM